MKTTPFLFVAGAALAATLCASDPSRGFPVARAAAEEAPPAKVPALTPAIENEIQKKGLAIAAEAFGVLSSRLGRAVEEAGYPNAIRFCSVHGIALTSSVGVTNQVALRRVARLARNPQNRADANELAIIRQFEDDFKRGVTPKPVVFANKPDYFTYYAPLALNLPLCLNCHGTPGVDVKPDLLALIRKTYPADEAIGFKLGQLRGLWSVDFKRSEFAPTP